MKKVLKVISILLITILSTIMFISKNKINVFAEITSIYDAMKIGTVFKTGTIIPYNEPFDTCVLDPTNEYCGEYSSNLCISFAQSDGEYKYKCKRNPNDTERELIIDNETSEYWILDSFGGGSGMWMNFVPYKYMVPEFNLTCDPNQTTLNEYSLCTLRVKYISEFNDIKFSLDTGDYELIELTSGDFFETPKLNEGIYSFNLKSIIKPTEEEKEITIATFTIKSKEEKNIDIENNIKIVNLNYMDITANETISEISTTVKHEKTIITPSDDNEIDAGKDVIINENPKTGNNSYMLLCIISVIFVSMSIFMIIIKKDNLEIK